MAVQLKKKKQTVLLKNQGIRRTVWITSNLPLFILVNLPAVRQS